MSARPPRTIVVGAGPAGLAAATVLHRAERPVTLLEARAQPGGWCRTTTLQGYRFETGPQTYRGPEGGPLETLARWAGLSDQLCPPSPAASKRYLLRHDRLHPVPRALPGLLGPRRILRALSEGLRAPAPRASESLTAFVQRRFGPGLEFVVEAFVSGVFAGAAEELELASAFPGLARAERDYGGVLRAARRGGFPPRQILGLREGLGSLTAALAEDLGPCLRCHAPVAALRAPGPDGTWEVELASGETLTAEQLWLAAPAFAAGELLAPLDPALGCLLRGIPYAPVAVVSLGYDQSAFREGPPVGFGFLAPRAERRRLLGCIFASSVFPDAAPPGKVSLRVMLGGRRDPGAVALSEAELLETATRELAPLLGITAPPEVSWVLRLERAIPQYVLGHGRRVAAIEQAAARWPGLALLGNAYRGISLCDTLADALAHAEGALGPPA